jgi:DNA (cytosine-5)-methyltransferase 1
MDVRDLLRMVRLGWRTPVRMLVADPPCTPWSRAGKRKGTTDTRDMLRETAELIALLRPRIYLLGNIPGLEDSNNLPIVQEVIGGLARAGYCVVDFAVLNAADFGVPQHRYRPFWFGHLHGPCIRWPRPTHADPEEIADTLPGVAALEPWVTCGQALGHLTPKELGRMVKLRKLNDRHAPAELDKVAPTMGAKHRSQSAQVLSLEGRSALPQSQRLVDADRPADTLQAREDRLGSGMTMTWPWPRPATAIMGDPRLGAPGHKDKRWKGKDKKRARSTTRAVLLSEKAAAILQGFPDDWVFSGETKKARWNQIGQAVPPPIGLAIARSIQGQLAATVDDGPPENYVPWSPPPPPPRMEVVHGEQQPLDLRGAS